MELEDASGGGGGAPRGAEGDGAIGEGAAGGAVAGGGGGDDGVVARPALPCGTFSAGGGGGLDAAPAAADSEVSTVGGGDGARSKTRSTADERLVPSTKYSRARRSSEYKRSQSSGVLLCTSKPVRGQ